MTLTEAHVPQIVETAEAFKAAQPEVELVLCPGEVFAPRMTYVPPAPRVARPQGALHMARRVLRSTGAIDALGVALYYPNCDLLSLFRTLDVLAEAGRPLHLVMAAAPSQWRDDPGAELGRGQANFTRDLGFWREPWSAEVQAEYAAGLVLMARAHPAVVALEWSDFSDAAPHTFPHGGAIDADGRPKPLHQRLAELRAKNFVFEHAWGDRL